MNLSYFYQILIILICDVFDVVKLQFAELNTYSTVVSRYLLTVWLFYQHQNKKRKRQLRVSSNFRFADYRVQRVKNIDLRIPRNDEVQEMTSAWRLRGFNIFRFSESDKNMKFNMNLLLDSSMFHMIQYIDTPNKPEFTYTVYFLCFA